MKTKIPTIKHAITLCLLICSAWLMIPANVSAQMVLGSWQNNTGDGWIDWPTLDSITNSAVDPSVYTFASGAVPGYAQSLEITDSGNHQNLAIKLENIPGGMAAFLTNNQLQFTFSVPSSASAGVSAGFSQVYQLAINASGYGFNGQPFSNFTETGTTNNNQSGQPNFYFSSGTPAQSQVVTVNYSNILSSITATPTTGYIELIFSFNNGGGAPAYYYINNVVLTNTSGGSGGSGGGSGGSGGSGSGPVLGSWQNNTGDGWIDWPTLDSITNSAVDPSIYTFASGVVTGYTQSLEITDSGNHQNLAIKLENIPGGMAAFLTNNQLSFTFSVPSSASAGVSAGFSQVYQLAINASGYGFNGQPFSNFTETGTTNNNQSGQPNFYFSSGTPAQSQVVTVNYSNILSSITATPTTGYIELVFSFNNGGGAPAYYYMNNVVLSEAGSGSGGGGGGTSNSSPVITYSLLSGPVNSSINSTNGIFTWRPTVSQAGTTNVVVVGATTSGSPTLSATNTYTVIVNPLSPTKINTFRVSGGQASLTVNGTQGPDYTVLASTNLVNWQTLFTTNQPALPLTLTIPNSTNLAEFYEIQIGP